MVRNYASGTGVATLKDRHCELATKLVLANFALSEAIQRKRQAGLLRRCRGDAPRKNDGSGFLL
jgi:hypothetical protein